MGVSALFFRLAAPETIWRWHGRLPERPMGADCKSVGFCLPRFESLTCHPREGPLTSAYADRRPFVVVRLCPARSGCWRESVRNTCGSFRLPEPGLPGCLRSPRAGARGPKGVLAAETTMPGRRCPPSAAQSHAGNLQVSKAPSPRGRRGARNELAHPGGFRTMWRPQACPPRPPRGCLAGNWSYLRLGGRHETNVAFRSRSRRSGCCTCSRRLAGICSAFVRRQSRGERPDPPTVLV